MLRIGPNATSDENSAINIIQDTQRVGIQKDPTGEYILDVSGAINCDAIFVGGTQFTGSSEGVWSQDASGDISYGDGNVFIGGNIIMSGGTINNNVTYDVSVNNGIFIINGVDAPELTLMRGFIYNFDQTNSTNSLHPIGFTTEDTYSNSTTYNSVSYTSGVSISGDVTTFIVPQDAPDQLYYECQYHPNMGNAINIVHLAQAGSSGSGSGGVWTQHDTGDISYGDGNVFIDAGLNVSSAVTLQDTLEVSNATTFNSSLRVVGAVTMEGGLEVSNYLKVPIGSSDVSSATYKGYIRYNDVSNEFQGYDSSENVWSSLGGSSSPTMTPVSITTTGGQETVYSGVDINSYTFTSDGVITSNIDVTVDIFMVGGGGGGGGTGLSDYSQTTMGVYGWPASTGTVRDAYFWIGGGGGAGQAVTHTNIVLSAGIPYNITIGAGGIYHQSGGSTTITYSGSTQGTLLEAVGGSPGTQYVGPVRELGRNGGASGNGFSGGTGGSSDPTQSGGGGGASGDGGGPSTGTGGAGVSNNYIDGTTSNYYASGGGGGGGYHSYGGYNDAIIGSRLVGYGIPGDPESSGTGVGHVAYDLYTGFRNNPNAEDNTGSGGGGGGRLSYWSYSTGGTGGSGIVVIRIDMTQTGIEPPSDDRLKHNEQDISGLELITQLKPQKYLKTRLMYEENYTLTVDDSGNYTNLLEGDSVSEEMGIIAQDILKIPELNFCVVNTTPYSLKYDNLFVLSIQAIKELKAKKDALQTTHDALQTSHDALQTTHNDSSIQTIKELKAKKDALQTSHDALKALLQSKGLLD